MDENKYFLTGRPGSGKSTVILKCVEGLRGLGFAVGGISTPELRSGGRRVGFSVVDLASGQMELMAGTEVTSRFRVGQYGFDLNGFESVALPALEHAEVNCDMVCIDEIGPMELLSRPFELRVEELIRGSKPMLAVLHRRYIRDYSGRGTLFYVTSESRERLVQLIVKLLENHLRLARP